MATNLIFLALLPGILIIIFKSFLIMKHTLKRENKKRYGMLILLQKEKKIAL